MTVIETKSGVIIPPTKRSGSSASWLPAETTKHMSHEPIAVLRARLKESPTPAAGIMSLGVMLKKAAAVARVSNYETEATARGAMAILEQHISAVVDDARKRFFIARASDDAEMRTAILEYTTRAKAALSAIVFESNASIFKTEKRQMEEIKQLVNRGEITPKRAELYEAKMLELTDRSCDHLDQDYEAVLQGLQRDLELTLRSFGRD